MRKLLRSSFVIIAIPVWWVTVIVALVFGLVAQVTQPVNQGMTAFSETLIDGILDASR